MSKKMNATEVKAKLLALLDEVERGEEIEITRRGVTIAKLTPTRSPRSLKGRLAGIARTADPDDDLLSTGVTWDLPE
jgi:prevent-host-death family protein